jgi:hypothetical protein
MWVCSDERGQPQAVNQLNVEILGLLSRGSSKASCRHEHGTMRFSLHRHPDEVLHRQGADSGGWRKAFALHRDDTTLGVTADNVDPSVIGAAGDLDTGKSLRLEERGNQPFEI